MMNDNQCPNEQELAAYYDGELPDPRKSELAAHLMACASCRAEIARLERISGLFRTAAIQRLSQISRQRLLRSAMRNNNDAGIIRLAWTLSGLAASVLVIGSLWLTRIGDRSDAQALSAPPPWVGLADSHDAALDQHEAASPAAAWYLASGSGDEQP